MSPVTLTGEQFADLIQMLGWLAIFGGFLGALLIWDAWQWIDRFRWARRRSARFARRRARGVFHG